MTRLIGGLDRLVAAILSGVTLVVRSSAVGEDSRAASFAGQLDSYLDVSTPEELEPCPERS